MALVVALVVALALALVLALVLTLVLVLAVALVLVLAVALAVELAVTVKLSSAARDTMLRQTPLAHRHCKVCGRNIQNCKSGTPTAKSCAWRCHLQCVYTAV